MSIRLRSTGLAKSTGYATSMMKIFVRGISNSIHFSLGYIPLNEFNIQEWKNCHFVSRIFWNFKIGEPFHIRLSLKWWLFLIPISSLSF